MPPSLGTTGRASLWYVAAPSVAALVMRGVYPDALERDFICPSCGKKIPSLAKLLVDKPVRTRVWDYIERTIEESKNGEGEKGEKTPKMGSVISTQRKSLFVQPTCQTRVVPGSLTSSDLEHIVQMPSRCSG